jgi:acyl-CoA synthetase (AMP-forming)/AMP-acid ligase II
MPEKTAEEFTADGWFKTGDVGRFGGMANGAPVPDDYLCIVGRSKDLIISGGYNVYPKEIESFIDDMDGVDESAVIGVPHPDFGEAVMAIVVAKPGSIPKNTGWDRTSLAVFIGVDHAGALLDILTEFAKREVNLTFIQSRPTGSVLGHYHFIIDAEGHIADAPVKEAVESLRAICEDIRFLGSYPREKASK